MTNHLEGTHDNLMNSASSDTTIPVSRTPSSNAANGTILNPTASGNVHQDNKQDASHKNTQLTQLLASPPRTGGSASVGVGNNASSSASSVNTSSPLHNQLTHPSGANSKSHTSNVLLSSSGNVPNATVQSKLFARQSRLVGSQSSTKQTGGMSTVTNTVSSLAIPNTVVSFKNNTGGLNPMNMQPRANFSVAGTPNLTNMANVQTRHPMINGPLPGPANTVMTGSPAPNSMALQNSNMMGGQAQLPNVMGGTHGLNQVNQQQALAKVRAQIYCNLARK